jgi:hypothetical protein
VSELPRGILQAVREAECVVHCGDYVSVAVVDELRRLSRHFVGVYGNADPGDVRKQLTSRATFEFEGMKITVVHPHWGGHPDGLVEELAAQFSGFDAVLFGHTHETCNLKLNGTLFLNPGQGYHSFMVPASLGILSVMDGKLEAEISVLSD